MSEFFEKGVNWLQGEGFVTNKEIAVKAALQEFHRMGIEEAKAAALQEYGIQKGKEILDSFYKDSREKTDAKIWALKQAGYDTTAVEMEVAKRRQAIEERKKQKQAQQEAKTTQRVEVKDAKIFDSIVNFSINIFKRILNVVGMSSEKQYMERVYEIAEIVVNEKDVQPNYTNEYGTKGTWCNKALDRMLSRLGIEHIMILNANPKTGKPDIGWTSANDMAKNLDKAAKEGKGVKLLTNGEEAQKYANKGYAVVAAWYNNNGSGHVALVIPNTKKYDDSFGPKIAQAGSHNYGPYDNKYIVDGFGWDRWKKGKIKLYVFIK